LHRPQPHILSYDIADPRRLVRVHRRLRDWGVPLQYSVFLVLVNAQQRGVLLGEVAALIDPAADDVRLYPLPLRPELVMLGEPPITLGVLLFDGDLGAAVALSATREEAPATGD
jgi:CRISPR-associated protein Cas2